MTTYCVMASIYDAIKTLDTSLIREERRDVAGSLKEERSTEGLRSYFYKLDEGIDKNLRDQFQQLIMECHMGEMPNDWRYETVKNLCVNFLEYWGKEEEPELEDYQDIVSEVAESTASIYNSELFFWLFDNPSRAVFEEDPYNESHDLAEITRNRQVEEISSMANVLLDGLSEMS